MRKEVDVLVIGGGSAGMAAALSAYASGAKSVLIVEKEEYLGGILNQCIHPGFGLHEYNQELTGPEFLTRLAREVAKTPIEVMLGAFCLSISPDLSAVVSSPEGIYLIKAKAIVMANGCLERSAGAIGMPGTRPKGVLTAGQAQLYLNQYGYIVGKRVFILGSGDIGLIMARRMTLEGAKVLGVAEIMPYSNGLKRNIAQCLEDFDIPLYLSHTVTKVAGKDKLEAIEISEVDKSMKPIPGTEMRFEVDTLLLSIGLIPNNSMLSSIGAKKGKNKGAEVDDFLMSSIPGIYSCGNVLHVHDLVDNVVEEARAAGRSAAAFSHFGIDGVGAMHQIKEGDGISYVVPSHYHEAAVDDLIIKFRCKKPVGKCQVKALIGEKCIKTWSRTSMVPSEMQILPITRKLLENNYGDLEIRLVELN